MQAIDSVKEITLLSLQMNCSPRLLATIAYLPSTACDGSSSSLRIHQFKSAREVLDVAEGLTVELETHRNL
jgi:hypothetical protein